MQVLPEPPEVVLGQRSLVPREAEPDATALVPGLEPRLDRFGGGVRSRGRDFDLGLLMWDGPDAEPDVATVRVFLGSRVAEGRGGGRVPALGAGWQHWLPARCLT